MIWGAVQNEQKASDEEATAQNMWGPGPRWPWRRLHLSRQRSAKCGLGLSEGSLERTCEGNTAACASVWSEKTATNSKSCSGALGMTYASKMNTPPLDANAKHRGVQRTALFVYAWQVNGFKGAYKHGKQRVSGLPTCHYGWRRRRHPRV